MSTVTPTRSVLVALREERQAMREGHAFLDEKCLLLAAEMVQELRRYDDARRAFDAAWKAALDSLAAAIERHGLQGVEVYPPVPLEGVSLEAKRRPLLGLTLQEAHLQAGGAAAPAAAQASPEGEALRDAFVAVISAAAPVAAIVGNLARLSAEYRRSIRRARALQDVLVPEADSAIADIETRLEELEQEDAIAMRMQPRSRQR